MLVDTELTSASFPLTLVSRFDQADGSAREGADPPGAGNLATLDQY